MKTKYEWIDREKFIKQRYENFQRNKEKLEKNPEYKDLFYFTDLNTPDGYGDTIKNLVVCDRCNENITEDPFIMIEDQLCYHEKCSPIKPTKKEITKQTKPKLIVVK